MLILPIKGKWFYMILSGKKKEEYRDIKPYYETRFRKLWQGSLIGGRAKRTIVFRNGYSKNSPAFTAVCTLDIGEGREEWGAEPGKEYYRLTIHEIIEKERLLMQAAGFMAHCPYEIGDRVEVAIVEGMAVTGYPRKLGTAIMQITDILAVHSLKRGTVTFLYELDGKKQMQLIPWEELAGEVKA